MPGEEEESTASADAQIIAEKDTAGASSAASMATDESAGKNKEPGGIASVPPPAPQYNRMIRKVIIPNNKSMLSNNYLASTISNIHISSKDTSSRIMYRH